MSLLEYNEERDLRLMRQDEREIGKELGIVKGKAEALIKILSIRDSVPDDLQKAIFNQTNPDILDEWLIVAAQAENCQDFRKQVAI